MQIMNMLFNEMLLLNGHLEIVKWLIEFRFMQKNFTPIDIHAEMNMLFDGVVKMVIWKCQMVG